MKYCVVLYAEEAMEAAEAIDTIIGPFATPEEADAYGRAQYVAEGGLEWDSFILANPEGTP